MAISSWLLWATLAAAAEPPEPGFQINAGLDGTWFVADMPGQGISVDVITERQELFVAWFTFEESGLLGLGSDDQRWVTAQGSYKRNRADLTLYNTAGGTFETPQAASTVPVGTAALHFVDCTRAVLRYEFDSGLSGELPFVRLTPDSFCHGLDTTYKLPPTFWIVGKAEGTDEDGWKASCELGLLYDVIETHQSPSLVEYTGIMGGHVGRQILDPTGDGFGFFIDLAPLAVTARLLHGDVVEIDGPAGHGDNSRLFLQLNRFSATVGEDGTLSGTFKCGPLDVESGGYVDNRTTVEGTWRFTLTP